MPPKKANDFLKPRETGEKSQDRSIISTKNTWKGEKDEGREGKGGGG